VNLAAQPPDMLLPEDRYSNVNIKEMKEPPAVYMTPRKVQYFLSITLPLDKYNITRT
jgi:hypothetical protein